jgi:hypothetical protein
VVPQRPPPQILACGCRERNAARPAVGAAFPPRTLSICTAGSSCHPRSRFCKPPHGHHMRTRLSTGGSLSYHRLQVALSSAPLSQRRTGTMDGKSCGGESMDWQHLLADRPTVSLDVIALVASRCGYERRSHRATCCASMHRARGDRVRARDTSPTPPFAARAARCAQAGAALQPSTAAPEASHRSGTLVRARTPRWRTREKTQPQRLTMPREALPAGLSSCRRLAMASPRWTFVRNY